MLNALIVTHSLALLSVSLATNCQSAASPFSLRGYYITFMRMPTFGLEAWKRNIDLFQSDGANTLILWMPGSFRSRKFPETWQYNRDHSNIKHDFVRRLIDYAHKKQIRVLLGFTPFGYDGVNKMGEAHPEWRAIGPDGKTIARFGIHCWGYNLCPAREDTQTFMREYIREMMVDFYPNADGLLIESSDYAICNCPRCGPKYYDNEFRFVRSISEEAWHRNPKATIVVYPHYFTGAKVPGMNVKAGRQTFDPRWTVFFTPHSANPDQELISKAAGSIWSDDSPALRTPSEIRDNARKARAIGCTGYMPSLESFSYVATEPEEGQSYMVGRRQIPFGFGWLNEGATPYAELPIRLNRIAYREYAKDPDLPDSEFREILGRELFGLAATRQSVSDAFTLLQVFMQDRTWSQPAPLSDPERMKILRASGQLSDERKQKYRTILRKVREIEERYRASGTPFRDLEKISAWLSKLWSGANAEMLDR